MQTVLIVLVALVGVLATVWSAVRMWRANRRGAPGELVLGYFCLMLAVSAASMLLLRAI